MPAPHKVVLKDLLDRLEAVAVRLEAAASPPPDTPFPTDPAAIEAADRYIEQRRHELMGEEAPYE